jgi:nitrile hydratase accessory protein
MGTLPGTGVTGPLSTPGLPQDAGGPIFNEPWEAKAFAITLRLHERGLFTWPEWAQALSRQLSHARTHGDPDLGDTYYQHWLTALETLVAAKGAASQEDLTRCAEAWREAAEHTPHGQPIVLDPRVGCCRTA